MAQVKNMMASKSTCVQTSDGLEDYFQQLPKEFAQVLEDNFWDLVLKSEEEWV